MNDETKAALDELGRRPLPIDEAERACELILWVRGEPARLAAALENLREACALRVDAVKCYGYGVEADEPGVRDQCAGEVRDTPLDATPLADELRTLRARVAELERELKATLASLSALRGVTTDALQQRARVAELETFIVDACREKTLHNSTPSLVAGASKLGIAAFEAWWAERAAESKP